MKREIGAWGLLVGGAFMSAASCTASDVSRASFGELPSGELVEAVTLEAGNGVSAVIITYGATLQALNVPGRDGKIVDVTLGHDTLEGYVQHHNYWGQTIGRYANRIAGGKFALDGKVYQLPQNNGENSLHGGFDGFDKRNWKIIATDADSVTLALRSPDGDQGYPGNLEVTVTYSLDQDGALTIDHEARTDAPTIVNLTNHALFNMAGEGAGNSTMDSQILTIPASHYLPVNDALIPTGEKRPVKNTVFDFTKGRSLTDGVRDGNDPQIVIGRGWDHNWVLDKGATEKPELVARLEDLTSGRVLEVLSTEPGLQFYSGNFLVGTLKGKSGHVYRMGDGIALEPQLFPDTPNQSDFGSARLDPGQVYRHSMIYRVSVKR